MTYSGYVCRIRNVRKHPNADRLAIGECFGNTVVVGLNTPDNELGVYFPCDGALSKEYLTANDLIGGVDEHGNRTGGFFEENGRVRAQKFRNVKSDGYYASLSSLSFTGVNPDDLTEGMVFTDINGHHICEKFVNPRTKEARGQREKRHRDPTHYLNFHEHIETEQLAYNLEAFKEGDVIVVTEKLHGTSARTAYAKKIVSTTGWRSIVNTLMYPILKKALFPPVSSWGYVSGSRRVVLSEVSPSFAGDKERVVRQFYHDYFVDKLHKGEEVYYEIVGYFNEDSPIMKEYSVEKLSDKDMVKKYGKKMVFSYGNAPGQHSIYVYRIAMINDDGVEVDLTYDEVCRRCSELCVNPVPIIDSGIVTDPKAMLQYLSDYIERESTLDDKHIMEGVVVRKDSSKWEVYKHKSFSYKVLEGLLKDTGVEDVEEAS